MLLRLAPADKVVHVTEKPPQPHVAISSTQRAVRVPRKRLAELVRFVAAEERVRAAEVDLAVVTSAQMAALNRRYLRRAGPTDVLSFDLSDDPAEGIRAQIVVCGDIAARQALRRGHTAQQELMLYVVHGLLHLIGCYEDASPQAAARMHARQEELLEAFRRPRR